MFDTIITLKNQMKSVLAMLRRTVCVATVSQVDSELRRVKVTFVTDDIPESDWLSVVGSRTKGVNVSWNMEEGEQVLCLFPPIGSMVRGYVLGSLSNVNARPYTSDVNKFGVRFKDGTLLEYDQATQTGVLKIQGATPSIQVGPSNIRIVSDVLIDGAVSISKTLDVGKATNLADVLNVQGAVSGMQTANFMGTVGAAGYGGPVAGGVAKMQNGMEVQGSATLNGVATLNGIKVSVDTHTHTDAKGRPTSPVTSSRMDELVTAIKRLFR